MVNAPDRIVVPFEGEGSGIGELSWGQYEIWSAMVRLKSWMPLGGIKRLSAGTTVAEIAEELRYLMSRYQSMRTRLRFDAEGRPSQVVSSSGEVTLDVFDAGDTDPEKAATAVADRYQETALDIATEWPIRMAVVRHQGSLTHMIVFISHFVADAVGAAVMLSEVAVRETAPVQGMPPLDQARWQRSPAGRRQNDAALRHWEGILRTIDPRRFNKPHEKCRPRYWRGEFDSPALALALRAVANGTGADSAAVLLASYAVSLTQVTGVNPAVIRPLASNRFRPGLSGVVCTATQAGLCVLDVAGLPFGEALARVQRAVMAAYKYSYFDHKDVVDLVARVGRERGADIDIACWFNDRRLSSGQSQPGPDPTPELIREALPNTTFRWILTRDHPSLEQLIVDAEDVPGAIRMTIHMDAHSLTPADGEALLRGMEAVAASAALDQRGE